MATQLIDLGNLRFIWKGNWDITQTYELNDTVRHNNIVWVFTNPIPATNVQITDTNYWSRMVEGSEIPPTEGQAGKVLKTDGTLSFWSDSFDTFKIGADITSFITAAGLTDVALGIQGQSNSFTQVALVNTGSGPGSSADFIAYASNGTNESGWVDMGITNQSFNDPLFTLTGPGDGYLFMSGAIAGVVQVSEFNVASGTLNLITSTPHQMIQGVVFDLVLPSVPALEGRYVVATAPTSTQIAVPVPVNYTGGNIPLTAVINSQLNKFTGDGNLVLATDGTGLSNNIIIAAGGLQTGSEQIIVSASGVDITGDVTTAGTTHQTGTVYVGANAKTFETVADLTNPAAVFELNGEPYAQLAIHNASSNSSTDVIAYTNNGNDASGWIDMGITGATFSDQTFPITGPHDGYIFMEAPAGTSGSGNLVVATGSNGTQNKIIFGAGGYDTGSTQMVITPNQSVKININTPSTSPSTGAFQVVGGVGIQGDVNIAGAITFGGSGTVVETENLSVTDPAVFVGSGNTGDAVDLAFVGEYGSSGIKYAGLARDASDGVFKFFKDITTKPTTTVNFGSETVAELASIKAGNITAAGNIVSTGTITANGGFVVSGGLTANSGVSLSGTVDIQEMRESVSNVTLSSNVGTLDWSAGNIYYIGTAPTGNMTFNLTNVPTDIDKIMTINVMVVQGATGYIPSTFQIAGTTQTIRWADGNAPVPTSSAGKLDIFNFTLHRLPNSTWVVLGTTALNF